MTRQFKKMVPLLTICVLLLGNSMTAFAFGMSKINCDSSKFLISEMVAYPEVTNENTIISDEDRAVVEENVNFIFDGWKEDNLRSPKSANLVAVTAVPVSEVLVYDELNDAYTQSIDYVKGLEANEDMAFDYAICFRYTTKTLLGGKSENIGYCFAGVSTGELQYTDVEDFEASDTSVVAAAAVMYSGTAAISFVY